MFFSDLKSFLTLVGFLVGISVGLLEGILVGFFDGFLVGICVGLFEGILVSFFEGDCCFRGQWYVDCELQNYIQLIKMRSCALTNDGSVEGTGVGLLLGWPDGLGVSATNNNSSFLSC